MPFIKSNVHTHTAFCDGKDSVDDMALAAIAAGFDTLGFSFHSYTPFDTSYCIRDYPAYIRELTRVKQTYAGRISILGGVELDLFGARPPHSDFVIGSVHYLKEGENFYPVDESPQKLKQVIDGVYSGDPYAAVRSFYAQVATLPRAIAPDIYGHFDLITVFNKGGAFFDEGDARYISAALSAADCLHKGAVVEVNLGRLFKGTGGIYPSPWLVRELVARGCRFMLSSDAHCTQALGYMFDEVCRQLKSLGVKSLVRYHGAALEEVEL